MTRAYVAVNKNLGKLIECMDRAHAKIKKLKKRRKPRTEKANQA